MRTMLRGKVTLLFMVLRMLLAIPAVALADNVVNDVAVDTNGDKIVTVQAGDTTGAAVGYKVVATGGDGGPQPPPPGTSTCNVTDGSSAKVAFTGLPTAATATPNELTFTACGVEQSVTFKAGAATPTGDYEIGVNVADSGTGSYNTTPAKFTLRVTAATPSDTTGPDITITTPPDPSATYLVNQQVLADYACSDPSGVATCAGSQGSTSVADGAAIDTGSVESKSFTVNATDTLNNASSLTHNYTVRRYDFDGFTSPVDNMPTLNKAKAGQAIPLKWRLMDNGSPVTNLESVKLTTQNLSCSRTVSTDLIEEYAAGSSSLQNLGDGYYQFNWKSPKDYANSCKTLTVNGLGVQSQANFEFTK
jgi:hypothetical protein